MVRRNRLYTVNRFNKGMFNPVQENLFPNGGALLAADRLASAKFGADYGDAGNTLSDYMNSTNAFGISKADNPFSKMNLQGGLGAMASTPIGGALVSGIAGTAGSLANNAISGGLESDAGSAISNIGGTVGSVVGAANPVLGAAIGVGSQLIGGLANRAFGMSTDQAKLNAANAGTAAYNNFVSNASSFDDIQGPEAQAEVQDAYKGGWFSSSKAKRKNAALRQARIDAKNYAFRGVDNNVNNLVDDQMNEALANYSAFGGELGTNGTDFTNGLLYVDTGGSHESNPFGGVLMGFDSEGIPNLVEEGETVYNDYVFSNRMEVPAFMLQDLGLPKGRKNISFADASKKLAQESEKRPNDPISKDGLNASLSKLAEIQEAERMKKQAKEYMGLEEYACGGKVNRFDDGGGLEKWLKEKHPEIKSRGYAIAAIKAALGNNSKDYEKAFKLAHRYIKDADSGNDVPSAKELQEYFYPEDTPLDIYTPEELELPSTEELEERERELERAEMEERRNMQRLDIPNGIVTPASFGIPAVTQNIKQPSRINIPRPNMEGYELPPTMRDDGTQVPYNETEEARRYSALMENLPSINAEELLTPTQKADLAENIMAARENIDLLGPNQTEVLQKRRPYDNFSFAEAAQRDTNYPGLYRTGDDIDDFVEVTSPEETPTSASVETAPSQEPAINSQYLWDNFWGNVNEYSKRRGSSRNKYQVDRTYKGNVKELENSDNYKAFTDYILNDATDDEHQKYFQWIDANTGRGNKYIDKNGKLIEGWQDAYTRARNDGLYGIQHYTPELQTAPTKEIPAEIAKKGTVEPTDGNTVTTPETGNTDKLQEGLENPKTYATWMRYAPAIGSGVMALTDAFGLTNKPDYGMADKIEAFARGASEAPKVSNKPIGDYLRYNPMDIWFEQNRMNANARATDRALSNMTSPSKAAGLLANGYNSQLASGNLYRNALEYNDAKRRDVADFNRKTNMFNSQMGLEAAMANARYRQQAQNLGLSGLAQAATMRDQIDARVGAAKSFNLSNFLTSLGNIGRENFAMNQLNWDKSRNYTTDASGRSGYKRKCGGKINRK